MTTREFTAIFVCLSSCNGIGAPGICSHLLVNSSRCLIVWRSASALSHMTLLAMQHKLGGQRKKCGCISTPNVRRATKEDIVQKSTVDPHVHTPARCSYSANRCQVFAENPSQTIDAIDSQWAIDVHQSDPTFFLRTSNFAVHQVVLPASSMLKAGLSKCASPL